MSLFIAVRPDERASEDLQDALGRVRRLPPAQDLRWQPEWQWHVTVAFLGDPPDDVDDEVVDRLDPVIRRAPVRDVRMAGAGCFGRQIVWIGIESGDARDQLSALASGIPPLLRGTGVQVDRRPWRPHVTVARARRGDAARAADLLADYAGPPWTVDELLVIRSTGGPRPEHRVIHRLGLRG